MCSSILNVLFISVLIVATGLLLVATFTPNWQVATASGDLRKALDLANKAAQSLKLNIKVDTKYSNGIISCEDFDFEQCKAAFKVSSPLYCLMKFTLLTLRR